MFGKTHNVNGSGTTLLTFLKSLDVMAYPCGRRRAKLEGTGSGAGVKYIPFDPKARLNTEENNRKYSGLNGYTQSYIHAWSGAQLSMSIAGYYFDINTGYGDINAFGQGLISTQKSFLEGEGATDSTQINSLDDAVSIYANIRLEETPLFYDGNRGLSYNTSILINQTGNDDSSSIDIIINNESAHTSDASYYFSGLSFSTEALAAYDQLTNVTYSTTNPTTACSITDIYKDGKKHQQVVSLKILQKNGNSWELYQPAKLPHIEHGETSDTVKVAKLTSESIVTSDSIVLNGIPVPSLEVKSQSDGKYRLVFSSKDN